MGPVAYSSTPFAPVVDGDVLPSAPWAALADGAARDVELLIGHSRDEYSLLAAQRPDIDEAHVDVLIDGLSPTPGAHRYRAAHWASTIADGGERRGADVADLALVDEVTERAEGLLDVGVGLVAVDLVPQPATFAPMAPPVSRSQHGGGAHEPHSR
jgi:carboxylesterase type B